jgi:hypothetical protein
MAVAQEQRPELPELGDLQALWKRRALRERPALQEFRERRCFRVRARRGRSAEQLRSREQRERVPAEVGAAGPARGPPRKAAEVEVPGR